MTKKTEPSSAVGNGWNLVPLTPEYIPAEHGGYVEAIEAALSDLDVRNIALSGNYGVGKSSILREVARRQRGRVVELSLSTLAPIEASKIDESVPIQATTPTNRIQHEIVKQLLYREDPSNTPASRFRRLERFRWRREVSTALVLGLVIAVFFLLIGWTGQISAVFTALNEIGVWTHLIVWGVATAVVLVVRWLFYGRLHIRELSAGSAKVTLDDNSVSYFDQYLDEIVYFFDVSDRDVIIFEDIDRFDDSHIFETLRALNTLLNAAPQIEKPIRFIYAIKDSIFDRIGLEAEGRKVESDPPDDPAQAETMRANRTKFFDLVIPVVPFITHLSARNLAAQLLGKIEQEVAPELLDLAAQYVPDMRLLKNVRNEFIVFRDRIFSGDGEKLNLSETDLFAMMLYKSTHLTDFEKIRLGTSVLDDLYKVSRDLVAENIRVLERERRSLRQSLRYADGATSRSARLGDLLVAHLKRTATAVSAVLGTRRQDSVTTSVDGSAKTDADLKSAEFWTAFVSAKGDPEVRQLMSTGHTLTFSRSSLAGALGDQLDSEIWNETDRELLIEQIDEKTRDIAFLRSADMGDLVGRPEFLVKNSNAAQSMETIAKTVLKPGLAYHLVRAGYINRNFTLYTSTFHGDRVSPAATNFIIHHVERNLMDEHFELTPEDVDAVVRERGRSALSEPALYNIDVLDRLLEVDVKAAQVMVRSLVTLGESQTRFLQAYLSAGDQRLRFVELFAPASSRALQYLIGQTDLDDAARAELVDVALAHLPPQKQRIDDEVSDYLLEHYIEFGTLTSDRTGAAPAELAAALFYEAGVVLPHLEPLGRHVRPSFVSRSLYEITHENLSLAIGNTATVALDVIRAADRVVYGHALQHLRNYLDAVEGLSATVDGRSGFIPVLEEVLEHEAPRLLDVIEHASPECLVTDLGSVSEQAWVPLAQHLRFPATFNNVSRYVVAFGIDAQLAEVLIDAGIITDVHSDDEEAKTALAIAILAARAELASAPLRAELVASLDLSDYLSTDAISAESGDLFALLLTHDIISDDAASYGHLATADWPTRKSFVRESTKFASYMTPELVRPDMAVLLASDEIDGAVKQVIIEQIADYAKVAGPRGLKELARFAISHGRTVPSDVVQRMAQGEVPASQVVQLLEPQLGTIARDQLLAVLSALTGAYERLTAVGYDKPKIPNTVADRALLVRLKQEGIVNSYDEIESQIRVNKKHK